MQIITKIPFIRSKLDTSGGGFNCWSDKNIRWKKSPETGDGHWSLFY